MKTEATDLVERRMAGVPFGILSKPDHPQRETRQTRRAAARESMKALGRRGRVMEKKIAIAGKRLRQVSKVLGQ